MVDEPGRSSRLRRARVLLVAGLAVAAGVIAGDGLAGLAHAPPNDLCSDYAGIPEGSDSTGTLDLWPLGLRCAYFVGSDEVRSEYFGATLAELWASMARSCRARRWSSRSTGSCDRGLLTRLTRAPAPPPRLPPARRPP